jgi:8-oxo-dGTP pyrophosphatase MutT (NUDIX family)
VTQPRAQGTEAPTRSAAYLRLREDAIAQLSEWHPPSREQELLRAEYLGHLERHFDGMAKAGPPAHLTGSVLVLDRAGANVLLTHHHKARRWFQFGGHFEATDASMWHGAAREAREESGIVGLSVLPDIVQLNRHDLSGAFGRCRQHLDVRYVALAPDAAEHSVSDESIDVRWWPATALPADTRDELLPLVQAAQTVIRR